MLDFKVRFLMIVEDIINFFKPSDAFVDSCVATSMMIDGYTDFEIDQFLSKQNGEKNT